jgi:hypothetical protein
MFGLSVGAILELAAAIALIVIGVLQYRKRDREGARTGSQAAVLLFLVAAIMIMHALYGFES